MNHPCIIIFSLLLSLNSLVAEQFSLQDKLQKQFEMYDQVHEQIILEPTHYYSRDAWEKKLSPGKAYIISEKEKTSLSNQQKQEAEKFRLINKQNSILNIDPLRNDEHLLQDFAHGIPKGGALHVHPNGTVSRRTAKKLLQKYNPVIDGKELLQKITEKGNLIYPSEIAFLNQLTPPKKFRDLPSATQESFINLFHMPRDPAFDHPFERFSSFFIIVNVIRDFGQNPRRDIIASCLKRAKNDGLSYIEFTLTLDIDDKPAIQDYDRWAKELLQETGVHFRLNIAFNRTKDPIENEKLLKQWLEYLEKHPSSVITGFDLVDNERHAPALETGFSIYVPLSAAIKGIHPQGYTTKLKRTMHAGELGDPRNVRDALIMVVDRVGHGVKLQEDPVVLEYARLKKLPIEINLVSNLKLQAIKNYHEHPFLLYLRLGLPVSLSTDNEGLLETSQTNEITTAIEQTDMSYCELKQMIYNSITTSFASIDLKNELIKKLDTQFIEFENKWKAILEQASTD